MLRLATRTRGGVDNIPQATGGQILNLAVVIRHYIFYINAWYASCNNNVVEDLPTDLIRRASVGLIRQSDEYVTQLLFEKVMDIYFVSSVLLSQCSTLLPSAMFYNITSFIKVTTERPLQKWCYKRNACRLHCG